MLEHLAPDVLISVEHIHLGCAGPIRGRCHDARERCVLDVAPDVEILTGAKVEPDPDSELGVAAKQVVRRHRPIVGCSSWRSSNRRCSETTYSSVGESG